MTSEYLLCVTFLVVAVGVALVVFVERLGFHRRQNEWRRVANKSA
jgi:hypothetical protein